MVRIYSPSVIGQIVSLMAYGAIVIYSYGGIEYHEMLSNEDYEVLFDLDDVMKELEDCE
jgi:hypothetical protein